MNRNAQSSRARKKKNQILQAAKKLFLEKGFAATSIDEIREQARVSKQTIYSYYESKEDLLFDVIEHQLFLLSDDACSEMLKKLDFSTPPDVEKSLVLFSRNLLDHFMQVDYLKLARMVVAEVVQFPELARLFRDAVPVRGLNNVEKLLMKANQSPCVTIDNIEIAARSLVGTLITYVFIDGVLSESKGSNALTDEQIRNIVRFYLPSILTTHVFIRQEGDHS
ncbi:TetR/AcrR family transcriptional regulator [Sporolactobacillus sp. Y61]|uniref:TetR/AcrR family transcriptional regulator n=1 Tax=Sporolactobacillus sp. Y61 TaxID=3160863 RepID=A0AAU8IDT1_9BACL|nr:TetR/AcrR family transcriptional regulator [Sporolactobacillus sp. THM19-2]RYL90442.1 TetR/AcrR family transcriptional regulator [Sporolactobacillus sp. THM19-2]